VPLGRCWGSILNDYRKNSRTKGIERKYESGKKEGVREGERKNE
jgi:hypothetical protein